MIKIVFINQKFTREIPEMVEIDKELKIINKNPVKMHGYLWYLKINITMKLVLI